MIRVHGQNAPQHGIPVIKVERAAIVAIDKKSVLAVDGLALNKASSYVTAKPSLIRRIIRPTQKCMLASENIFASW